ncbi:signal peptidase I [Zongyangia hominis]|nr:signal peptidase I [Zongyangia hominis]
MEDYTPMEEFDPIDPLEKEPILGQTIIKGKRKNKNKKYNGLYEWVETIVAGVVCAVLVFTFVIRMVGVEGVSMQPTLYENDRIFLSNLVPLYKNGDVVVVTKHHIDDRPLVKRIIATEGQTIDIDFEAGKVYLDGVELDEPYIKEATHTKEGTEFPLTVPEGYVFCMGDNRNESMDSRDPRVGLIDTRYILGKAIFRVYPFTSFGFIK